MGQAVRVRVDSRRVAAPDGSGAPGAAANQPPDEVRQEMAGEAYERGPALYVRYREPDAGMGESAALVRLMDDSLRIVRRGGADSEFDFRPGRRTPARMQTPYGDLHLEVFTHELSSGVGEDGGRWAAWTYDLYVEEAWSGTFAVRIGLAPTPDA